jgi:urease accessory protein
MAQAGIRMHTTSASTDIRTKDAQMDFAKHASGMESDLLELRLLHLADSAFPIGALAHSFGLESLIAAELIGVQDLPVFFGGFLEEAGLLEAVFCRESFRLGSGVRAGELTAHDLDMFKQDWLTLNERLSALKLARESRIGSGSLGRNFLSTISALEDHTEMREALRASKETQGLIHQSVSFGLVSGVLGFQEDRTVLALLHACMASLVSACQRMLPLGQNAATRILWELKASIVATTRRSAACSLEDASCFMPLLDWGAMEHPALATRLFIS